MVLSMLIFGGPTLHYFALALTIGILFGIYSSVFVAAAIAMWLGVKREDLVKAGRKGRSTRTTRTPAPWCRVECWCDSRTPTRQPHRSMATVGDHASLAAAGAARSTPKSWSRACRRWSVRSLSGRWRPSACCDGGRPGHRHAPARHRASPSRSTARPGTRAWSTHCRNALRHGVTAVAQRRAGRRRRSKLSLVDDDTIEREILTSRLALAIMDRAAWEFTDLRARVSRCSSAARNSTPHDLLRAHVLARIVLTPGAAPAWTTGRLARAAAGAARGVRACWSRRPTTRPTAGWCQQRVLPESTCAR